MIQYTSHTARRETALEATKDVYGHLLEGDERAATGAISGALLGKLRLVAPERPEKPEDRLNDKGPS
ncbi:hypothetical protein [Nonomuraea sp. NPDC005650]|uniref:hypothetical protein n=1 Tax=Nonomuraea sp. NPDC005650 TaxID=3157045 RepID=UPI0033A7D9BE